MSETQCNTNELGQLRLKLREELEFTPQEYGGVTSIVIEDKTNSRFYRIGTSEYTLISLLDGRTTLSEALGIAAEALGPNAFSEQDVAVICKWLVDSQLATTDKSVTVERLMDVADEAKRRKRLSWLNPMILKVPLGSPEPLLQKLAPWLGWLVSRPTAIAWLLLSLFAVFQLSGRWSELTHSANLVVARDNWLWLGVTFLFLKVLHELAHGIACKRFGGVVRETGLVFILFVPIPYVDVTSAWRFPSKWQRIAVSAAGMFVETLVAMIAVFVWCYTDDPMLRHHAFNAMMMAGVTTILFNINFLMRFDGYYILADLLEIPNLYGLGQQYLAYLGRRYFLGVPVNAPRWSRGRSTVIKVYGVASLVWRVLICTTLVLAAATLFAGAGLVLSVIAVVLWLGFPLARFVKYLVKEDSRERPNRGRLAAASSLTIGTLVIVLTVVPWPFRVEAPAVVRYSDLHVVRAESAGFLRELRVGPGDTVTSGQVLAVLDNPQLDSELADLRLAIEQSELRSRSLYQEGSIAAYQAENQARVALESRAAQRERDTKNLVIRAPADGQLVNSDFESLRDQYIPVGKELFQIADESSKELMVSISQYDVAQFQSSVGESVCVSCPRRESIAARLVRVSPRARVDITDAAITSLAGGPLPVRPVGNQGDDSQESWQLLEPRFTGIVALMSLDGDQLRAGQSSTVTLSGYDRSVGEVVLRCFDQWLGNRLPL